MSRSTAEKPLVYSCSGCSSVAQLANHLALRLQSENVAEMSCIAGVGGDVPPLVKKARSGRPILALDGCHLQCVRHSLGRHGIEPTWHELLTDYGVKKQYRESWPEKAAEGIFPQLVARLQPFDRDRDAADPAQRLTGTD